MGAITHLIAGVPVSDLDAGIDWYTRFFGRPHDMRVGEEMLWEIDEHAWLFIEPNAARAGAARITLAVAGLDALLERVAAHGIEHEPIETYANGVRHVNGPIPTGTRSRSPSLPTPRARHPNQQPAAFDGADAPAVNRRVVEPRDLLMLGEVGLEQRPHLLPSARAAGDPEDQPYHDSGSLRVTDGATPLCRTRSLRAAAASTAALDDVNREGSSEGACESAVASGGGEGTHRRSR
jgi:hypothetical protein